MLEGLLDGAGHEQMRAERDARRAQGQRAGIGVGLFLAHSGLGEEETVSATLVDGELLVHSAAAEIGQGLDRVIRLVAAETWGDAVSVRVVTGTTIATPPTRGTFASRSVIFVGSAVRSACERLLAATREEAGRRLGVAPDRLVKEAGGFGDGRGNALTWAELGPLTAEGEHRDSEVVFGFGGHLALVTVDPDTGKVRIEQLALGYDCGRAIDRAGVEGAAGRRGRDGRRRDPVRGAALRRRRAAAPPATFMDYLVPTLAEIPDVGVSVFEYPATGNPLGAKGAGEAGVIGVAAAIGNALADAGGGVRGFTELPLRAGAGHWRRSKPGRWACLACQLSCHQLRKWRCHARSHRPDLGRKDHRPEAPARQSAD